VVQVVEIDWTPGEGFHPAEGGEGDNWAGRKTRSQLHPWGAPPLGLEGEGELAEEVDHEIPSVRSDEGKDLHALVPFPAVSDVRIGEIFGCHWQVGTKAEALEDVESPEEVGCLQGEREVDVVRHPEMAVRHDRQSAAHQVADVGPIQLGNE
jgi:hypothetical protein